jgi:hypothetical protein
MVMHRYLGIALAVPMLAWCLSGLVMIWVSYPKFEPHQRIESLRPLKFPACCEVAALRATLGETPIQAFQIEMLADSPVLRVEVPGRPQLVFDLVGGVLLSSVDPGSAERISEAYVDTTRISAAPSAPQVLSVDQWTVAGEFNSERPLFRVALNDADLTEIYISSHTGEVVQRTNSAQRMGNYFGAVTHWIYPTMIRRHPAVWNWIVIVLSAAGVILTLLGIILGLARAHWRGAQTVSPWRGWRLWHHTFGLIFGLLTLSWVGSGLLSMNPGGVLESDYGSAERADVAGLTMTVSDAINVVQRLANPNGMSTDPIAAGLKQIASAPLGGVLYLLATSRNQHRLDPVNFNSSPIVLGEVRQALTRVIRDGAMEMASLPQGDEYLSAGHNRVVNPTYRAISTRDGSRYYIDAASGALIAKYDESARRYRWWFEALHRWDFIPGFRMGVVRGSVVAALLLGVTISVGSGAVLAYRRIMRSDSTIQPATGSSMAP